MHRFVALMGVALATALAGCADSHKDFPDLWVQGTVSDPDGAAVAGAVVEVLGRNASTAEDGSYLLLGHTIEPVDAAAWNATAPGYQPANGTTPVRIGHVWLNITLERMGPLPDAGPAPAIEVETWDAVIACDAVAVVGHDHGSGAPDPSEHTDCDPSGDHPQQAFTRPDGTQGLVVSVVWEPETPLAEYLTAILTDADGEALAWSEDRSPIRLQVPREGIPAEVVLHVLAGADDGDTGLGVARDQPFSAELHWFLWQDAPAGYAP